MSNDKFVEMWKPIKIGSVEIKNRFSMAPMCCGFVDHGSLTEQYISYFARRARGGVGLIVTSPAMAYTGGSVLHVQNPNLHSRADIGRWNELVETIHAFDCKVFLQLMAGSAGRQIPRGMPTKAPSAVPFSAWMKRRFLLLFTHTKDWESSSSRRSRPLIRPPSTKSKRKSKKNSSELRKRKRPWKKSGG
ncbi:MAG: hypothetical protein ACE5K3_10645 [bacterium]